MFFVIAGVVVTLAAMTLAVAGLGIVQRRIVPDALERDNAVIGHVYGTLGVLYSVLLAFVVVMVWQRYVDSREVVEREANALDDLFRDAQAYAPATRVRVRQTIDDYARAVLDDEWRAMKDRRESARAAAAFDSIWAAYHAIRPATEAEWLWHEQSIERLNDLGDERRLRLLRSQLRPPSAMRVTIYGLGIVIVGVSYLFKAANARVHAIITAALAGALALILLILSALDHPFGRLTPIQPLAFEQVIRDFEATSHR